jgi:ABC-type uncharacterized transport system auxiliary subunit
MRPVGPAKTLSQDEVLGKRTAQRESRRDDSPQTPPIYGQFWALGLMFLTLLLTGCGAARPNKYYQLTVPSDAAADPPGDPLPITLLLGPLQSSHLYREDHIVYSSAGENMGTYEYQRWAEPPTEMIEEVLFRTFRSSGHYREVYFLHSNLHGDYLLHGHLYDFKELTGSPVSARLILELELRDIKSGNTVWTHFYSHDEPAKGKDVSDVVAALDRNVQRAAAEMQSQLSQYFSAHPIPAPQPSQ